MESGSPLAEDLGAARWVHARVFGAEGTLLYSTYPGENGTLSEYDVERPRAFYWPRGEIPERHSVWAPIAREIANAPVNSSMEFRGVKVADLRQERITVERAWRVDRYEVVPRKAALGALENVTAGSRTYLLGLIPVDVVAADNETAVIRYAIEDELVLDVPRAIGLQLTVKPAPGNTIEFSIDAPAGRFTAHKNCIAPHQVFTSGHYVLVERGRNELVLDRYVGEVEPHLVGQTLDIEMRFFWAEPPAKEAMIGPLMSLE